MRTLGLLVAWLVTVPLGLLYNSSPTLAKSDSGANCAPAQWKFVTSEPRVAFSKVAFVDALIAHGHDGKCLWATRDGGRHWRQQYCASSQPGMQDTLSDMQFFTHAEGWLLEGSHLMHTRDGGQTWTKHAFDGAIVRRLRFLDRQFGWWVGEQSLSGVPDTRGVIYATNDGGRTWTELPTKIQVKYRWRFEGLWPISSTNLWAVGSFILHSTDSGKTWRRPRIAPSELHNLRNSSIQFGEPQVGWIRRVPSENYLFTRDGGLSWVPRLPPVKPPFLDDLVYLSPTEAWAVAGSVYASFDGGNSWRPILRGGYGTATDDPTFFTLQYLRNERLLIVTSDQGVAFCVLTGGAGRAAAR